MIRRFILSEVLFGGVTFRWPRPSSGALAKEPVKQHVNGSIAMVGRRIVGRQQGAVPVVNGLRCE